MTTMQNLWSLRFRVGVFTVLTLLLIGGLSVYVNDRPFWWRQCQLVHINIEDATGLKTKSPIRSLGIQIGYLNTIQLTETHVRLGICVTAPVEVLPATRAYIRGEGFLGDKFVELKPVRYLGETPAPSPEASPLGQALRGFSRLLVAEAWAEEASAQATPRAPRPAPQGTRRADGAREIPVGSESQDVQQLVNQVNQLVGEMKGLTNNLKQAIDPVELRQTMVQLNRTLENASRTLAPEGNLNSTAQRTLAKLEDAIEQLRDQMTRVNKGEGSLGMLLNDPTYAEEIREAIRNVNRLLSQVGGVRFVVNLGVENIPVYEGARGWFQLQIWPNRTRYYRLGITVDPRGSRRVTNTTTTSAGVMTTTQVTQVDQGAFLFTAMFGKVFKNRLELAAGALHNDGTGSVALWLGPTDMEDLIVLRDDVYSRGQGFGLDNRVSVTVRPFRGPNVLSSLYVVGSVEGYRKVNGSIPVAYGAGVTFDDNDIKLLFAFR